MSTLSEVPTFYVDCSTFFRTRHSDDTILLVVPVEGSIRRPEFDFSEVTEHSNDAASAASIQPENFFLNCLCFFEVRGRLSDKLSIYSLPGRQEVQHFVNIYPPNCRNTAHPTEPGCSFQHI